MSDAATQGSEIIVDLSRFAASLTYKPGWKFKIGGPGNRFLCVFATTPDSSDPSRVRTTQHMFEHPPLPAPLREVARWVFDSLRLCELHECGEFFTVDGFRPYLPHHQDAGDPYVVVDRWES